MAQETDERERRLEEGERRVLVVIDMLNGFLDPRGSLYSGEQAREIIQPVRERVERYAEAGRPIIFCADHHDPDDEEFNVFGRHCVAGSWESEIVPEIPVPQGAAIVPKRRYSCFFDSELGAMLERLRPDVVEVVGLATNICVLYTASDLRNRDYRVQVPADCVVSFDADAHRWALGQLENVLGVEVVPSRKEVEA